MADVVVDPEIPPDDAALLRDGRDVLLRMRQGWAPEERRGRNVAGTAVVAGIMASFGLLVGVGPFGRGAGLLMLALIGFPVLVLLFVRDDPHDDDPGERETYELLRWYEGRYVLADDLDESSRRLLGRARNAIAAVTRSQVNAEGLLDDVRNAVMLPAQEWEIARLLAKLSALRAQHRETVTGGMTPEVAAVAAPLGRALDTSEEAVLARVEALERYAANVAEADRAYRAHHQIEELRGRIHQYEELVAESGADAFAVPELSRLAEDADRLEQALRRSIGSARDAFRHLDPPPGPDPRSRPNPSTNPRPNPGPNR